MEVYYADRCEPLSDAVSKGEMTMKTLVHGHYPGESLPKKVLPGLLTVGHWNAQKRQKWGLQWHRNEGLEISFLRSGSLDFHTAGMSTSLEAGDMTICRPWELHRLGNPKIDPSVLQWIILGQNVRAPSERWIWPDWIILSKQDLNELSRLLLYNTESAVRPPQEMADCWNVLYDAVQENRNASHLSRIAILINDLLLHLLHFLRANQELKSTDSEVMETPAYRTVRIFLKELENIPTQLERRWTIAEMASLCHMSESRFTQCCGQLTQLSPINFLNKCRIDLAMKVMRRSPEQSIAQMAEKCGFTSSQYFATVFKKTTGMTPKEYLGNIISEHEEP